MNVVLTLVFVIIFVLGNRKCYCYSNESSPIREIRPIPGPTWNETYAYKLRNDLLTNYDKYAMPGHHDEIVTVKMRIIVNHIDTEEINSTLSISCILVLVWQDSKLKWNDKDYGGITTITMADHEFWQPDIYLYNSVSTGGEAITRYGNPNARVYRDGTIEWRVPLKFRALCEFNLYYWPFDTQHCHLLFGSWTRSAREIQLKPTYYPSNEYSVYVWNTAHVQWEISHSSELVTNSRDCCPDKFYQVRFNFTLIRRSSYATIVSISALAMVSMILMQSWLPSKGGDRIILSCFTAIIISMFLIYFVRKFPAMGIKMPWIVLFYTTSLYIVCFQLIESIFVMLLVKPKEKQTLPWNIKKHLKGKLGKILFLESHTFECHCDNDQTAEEMKDYQQTEFDNKIEEDDGIIIKSTPESRIQHEWEILVLAIDRMFFIVYIFVYIVLFFAYLI